MKTHPRFGDFLLFRKLSASPLGSVFRAGRLQARTVDRVALLLCFDGEGINRERLAADPVRREETLDALETPRFARGLAQGSVDGVSFVAYDYLIGRSLSETLRRLRDRGEVPEPSYLLALIEQASGALAAAAKIRVEGVPVRHGFMIPELLLLSAEGRVYPLAFSFAAALARQEALRENYARYLSPELLAGGDGRPADDIYSLAAILFEALTGAPPEPGDSTSAQVDRALLAHRGEPLPPALQDLLKRGLADADSRPDCHAFHRALGVALQQCDQTPSQFQLAFFLHHLFRDELEAEAVALRAEKNLRFDPVVLSPVEEPPPPGAPAEQPAPDSGDEVLSVPYAPSPPSVPDGSHVQARRGLAGRPFLAGLTLSLSAALAVNAVAGRLENDPSSHQAPATSPAGGAEAKTNRQLELRRLVAQRGARLQTELESEYEPRLTALRRELAEARRASAPRSRSGEGRSPAPAASSLEAATSTPLLPNTQGPEPERRPVLGPGAATATHEEPPREASTSPAGGVSPPSVDSSLEEGPRAAIPVVEVAVAAAPGPVPPHDPLPSIPEAADGAAREFSPPRLVEPPRPVYPPAAQRLQKTARVQLRVLVDAQGRARETEIISVPRGFGFEEAAMTAAASTRWQPALRDGEVTEAWAVLTIDFRL